MRTQKLSIGTKVTAWVKPKTAKSNTGEDGIITDCYRSCNGVITYRVEIRNGGGFTYVTQRFLTIL